MADEKNNNVVPFSSLASTKKEISKISRRLGISYEQGRLRTLEAIVKLNLDQGFHVIDREECGAKGHEPDGKAN